MSQDAARSRNPLARRPSCWGLLVGLRIPLPRPRPGMFSMFLGEPQRPLIPGNTTETEGSKIVEAVWTPLVTFDVKRPRGHLRQRGGLSPQRTTPHWTISSSPAGPGRQPGDSRILCKGMELHGFEHHQCPRRVVLLLSNVAGYVKAQGEDGKEPTSTKMWGLGAKDKDTIEVTPAEPFAIFPVTLGYSALIRSRVFYRTRGLRKEAHRVGPVQVETEWVPGHGMTLT